MMGREESSRCALLSLITCLLSQTSALSPSRQENQTLANCLLRIYFQMSFFSLRVLDKELEKSLSQLGEHN